jgi:long-chain-fatty-acid--[acyl-carrier-protein] ligase
MLRLLRYILWGISRLVLALRYRIRVQGLQQVRKLPGPLLLLPNHPGLNDPMLVLGAVWPSLKPRPMVYEGNFRGLLYPVMGLLNAVRVPSLEQASMNARDRAREAVAGVIEGLRQGDNLILWPAGHLQTDGAERLGGARTVADVLQEVPEATVVLVRTRGAFGGMYTYAPTGRHPYLGRRMLAGIGWLLANLLLFMPRRRIEILLEPVQKQDLPEPRRETLNPWLEEHYNRDGPEAPIFVPYHFLFGRRSFEYPPLQEGEEIDLAKVQPQTREAIGHIVADKLGRPLTEAEDRAETTFDQLGLDSLDRMEMMLRVEQQFGFSGEAVPSDLGQLWALAQGLAHRGPSKPAPPEWFRPPSDTKPLEILGETVPEALINRVLACRRDVTVADDMAGVLTYERLLVGVLTLSKRLAQLPAANVGLMLPASVASDVAFVALHFAGKLPVVLNWTTGPANLAHAARLMGLTHVVTSRAFIDRSGVHIEGVEYLFLEDMRKQIRKGEQLRTLLAVRWLPGLIRRRLPKLDPEQPAVVLFTSGSEKAPKAVPLTHRNLLTNQRATVAFFGVTRADSLLGFLPAFHSFGMAVTGLMPLLGGMKVVRHPDPTDAAGLARKLGAYRPTLLAGTPTFVSFILERAEPGQLDSLRLIIVGAEKCPDALRDRCAQAVPGAELLEGYGITECSPVVGGNPPGGNRPGTLGKPLPGVEVCVVDLDTHEVLPPGCMGMLLVSGPNIFPGYLGHEGPSPFTERGGKRWYVTGDLATLDHEGYIHFGGRLKRFLKAGGEMISLPALEEPFVRRYPPGKEGPRVAVEGIETEDGRRIVLFTMEPMGLQEANRLLESEGFRGVMRLTEVRRLDQIPVLGTGKTDYKALRALIAAGSPGLAVAKSEVRPAV